MSMCELCGIEGADVCVPRDNPNLAIGSSAIEECKSYQDALARERGPRGGLIRHTVEADAEFDHCVQGADREVLPEIVRRYVPNFDCSPPPQRSAA